MFIVSHPILSCFELIPMLSKAIIFAPFSIMSDYVHYMCLNRSLSKSTVITYTTQDLGSNVFKQNFLNEYRDKIEEMFRSRPVWTTSAFANVIELREVPLRTQLLPQFAFYANTGIS